MVASSMKRRLLGLTLVLPLLDPLALFVRASAAGAHECRDHVCMCARRCPPMKDAPGPWHGHAGERPTLRGACNHDPAGVIGSVTPGVPPAAAWRAVAPSLAFEQCAAAGVTPQGFAEIDPPPPRAS
jgi:hypothetical protein